MAHDVEAMLKDLKTVRMIELREDSIMNYPPLVSIIKGVSGPWGVVTDLISEEVYITENKGNSIVVFNSNGDLLRKLELSYLGNKASVTTNLDHPCEITLDHNDQFILADRYNHCIRRISKEGQILDVAGTRGKGPHQFLHPTGIAFNYFNKKIYVTDVNNHRIQVLNNDFTFYKTFGGDNGNKILSYPSSVCTNSTGQIFVVDNGNRCVQTFTAEGDYTGKFGSFDEDGELDSVMGISIDNSTDSLYVSERRNKCISKFSSKGNFISYFGGGYLEDPCCLALDNKGRLYISEYRTDMVKIFTKF